MPNALARDVGFKVGPVLLDVLAKHYLERGKLDGEHEPVQLRKDGILFDEAFTIVKSFLNTASWHTVEDLQAFSNTRTPSPPWVKVVRICVPMSSCDQAAALLIQVLGGEEFCRQLVGGVKWWQVRGVNGVDGQWIVAKKDWREAKRRDKEQRANPGQPAPKQSTTSSTEEDATYNKDMDAMRCILFLHGGGFYFGSVDQERYSIQRLARKINGRVYAINYRLAPQYPFPCALQDALAAYLYLIQPPSGSPHKPVDPAHIVVAGDSAGGALSLALLQVIRDAGLPAPAGGILISPWCDLTHSFPSIHTNTTTDVIPDCGLSFHKPSTLWPPPPEELSSRVHASLRHRIQQAFKFDGITGFDPTATVIPEQTSETAAASSSKVTNAPDSSPVNVGATANLPSVDQGHGTRSRKISLTTETNERIEIDRQVHFYAENSLITHPLISASLSYLGGLPPLFIIAGDREVLRDEIIYAAHKAANPEKYPIPERSKQLYPRLRDLKPEDMKPTSVHLQVYDDSPHVLPILFAFTNPAKFCFRAMAQFCKFATNMTTATPPVIAPATFISTSPEPSIHENGSGEAGEGGAGVTRSGSLRPDSSLGRSTLTRRLSNRMSSFIRRRSIGAFPTTSTGSGEDKDWSSPNSRPESSQSRLESSPSSFIAPQVVNAPSATTDTDVGGPRFSFSTPSLQAPGDRFAGEAMTYTHIKDSKHWECGMIRERVGIDGVIRPLEPENELEALTFPAEKIGKMSELTLRRCLDYQDRFDKKFAHTYKSVEKHRRRNVERSKRDTIRQLSHLRKNMMNRGSNGNGNGRGKSVERDNGQAPAASRESSADFKEYMLSSPRWAWALDENERPPPSSIVSRRDTEEARELAQVADLALGEDSSSFSGNNLWSVVVNFLTVTPGKSRFVKGAPGLGVQEEEGGATVRKRSSWLKFPKLHHRSGHHKGSTTTTTQVKGDSTAAAEEKPALEA